MLAAAQGFDAIIGIEFAPLICQIAEQNLVRFFRPETRQMVHHQCGCHVS